MKCPKCNHPIERGKDKVLETRKTMDGEAIRRKRKCANCGKYFWTVEEIDFMTKMNDPKIDPKKVIYRDPLFIREDRDH